MYGQLCSSMLESRRFPVYEPDRVRGRPDIVMVNIRGKAVGIQQESPQPRAEDQRRMFLPATCRYPRKYSALSAPAYKPIRIDFYQLVGNDRPALLLE